MKWPYGLAGRAPFEVLLNLAGGGFLLALVLTTQLLGTVETLSGFCQAQEGYLSNFHPVIERDGELGDVAQLQGEVPPF
jgi:hypothetical protein